MNGFPDARLHPEIGQNCLNKTPPYNPCCSLSCRRTALSTEAFTRNSSPHIRQVRCWILFSGPSWTLEDKGIAGRLSIDTSKGFGGDCIGGIDGWIESVVISPNTGEVTSEGLGEGCIIEEGGRLESVTISLNVSEATSASDMLGVGGSCSLMLRETGVWLTLMSSYQLVHPNDNRSKAEYSLLTRET